MGETLGGLLAYVVTGLAWLRLRPADAAYAACLTVLVTFLPFWLSIPRYLLAMYPLFLLAGRIRSMPIQAAMALGSLALMFALAIAFTHGEWAF